MPEENVIEDAGTDDRDQHQEDRNGGQLDVSTLLIVLISHVHENLHQI